MLRMPAIAAALLSLSAPAVAHQGTCFASVAEALERAATMGGESVVATLDLGPSRARSRGWLTIHPDTGDWTVLQEMPTPGGGVPRACVVLYGAAIRDLGGNPVFILGTDT